MFADHKTMSLVRRGCEGRRCQVHQHTPIHPSAHRAFQYRSERGQMHQKLEAIECTNALSSAPSRKAGRQAHRKYEEGVLGQIRNGARLGFANSG